MKIITKQDTNLLFFFSNTLVGGAETNILKISKELFLRGFKIHFAVLEDNGPLFTLFNDEFHESFTVLNIGVKSIIKSSVIFNKLINDYNIKYVSCFGLRVDLFVRAQKLVFFNSRYKIISNIRASENWRNPFHSLIDRLTSGLVHQWVSNSRAGKNTFIKREGIDANKIDVIYNFIDEIPGNNRNVKEISHLRIGVLANYKKSKGHYNLINISQLLSSKSIAHQFICAGYDYTNGDLQNTIICSGREDYIKLIGYIKDKNNFFNSIDVLFLPSFIEGLPTSVIEAMAFGIPVVSSNVDGLPEVIINDYNGYICDPMDFSAFTEYLCSIKSIDVQQKFIDNSNKVLKEMFNKDKNVSQWVDIFSK